MSEMDELARKMKQAEGDMIREMETIVGNRDEEWKRISEMAGLDEEGNIAPHKFDGPIKFSHSGMWSLRYKTPSDKE